MDAKYAFAFSLSGIAPLMLSKIEDFMIWLEGRLDRSHFSLLATHSAFSAS
jgi:hypothetical protein